ncbi:MAG: DUF1648 domain-containing protein [Acidimicrobiia bacterium]|nr:DUF1648 domain-containing protein [Acidimicrobiia bacterium]
MKVARSWLTLGVVPGLLLALIALPFALYWNELPNPMATHWDLGGTPNGSMPPLVLLLLLAALYIAVYWAITRVLARTPYEGPSFIAGLFGIGGLLAAISWSSIQVNREEASWETATGFGLLEILLTVGIALGLGAIGWALAGGRSIERTPPAAAVPTLDLDRPSAAVWSSRGNGLILQVVGAVLILIGLATWGWSTLILIALGVVVLVFAEVRVTVAQRGVVVSLGWLGVPSWTVPMDVIERAEVEQVNPMAYGGWGYRLRPGVRAIVTRGGESLRLVRAEKADLVLTVDDAATGAGVINSMLGVGSAT